MAGHIGAYRLGVPAAAAFLLMQGVAVAGDRMVVQHARQPTSAESGLGYEYTFRVTKHGSGEPVDGAHFTIATDMPAMPGAHHMPHVTAEPAGEPGAYKAAFDFDMPGDWNLILRFSKPIRDQVVIPDTIDMQSGDMQSGDVQSGDVQPGGKGRATGHGGHGTDHSGHGRASEGMDHSGHGVKE